VKEPAIVWRNPKDVQRRRLYNQARQGANYRLYIVVRSSEDDGAWEGLPNLEVIEGGARTSKEEWRAAPSRA